MIYRVITAVFLMNLSFTVPVFASDFQPWSENVFVHIDREFGAQAASRLRYLHKLISENQTKTVNEKLQLANDTLNKLPWIADQVHWKDADYWATPMETIATFGGDCEDIAVVKWLVLRLLGIPSKHLNLAYVKIKSSGESHMVLLYVDKIDKPIGERTSWVLDNYVKEIKKGSERTDLLAIYATDAKGGIVLFTDNGKDRSIKGIYEDRKMKKLDELKIKIAENMSKFQKINDGRPLLPL